jgi:two-component system NtrC family response regulator
MVSSKGRVLIVDDDIDILESMAEWFVAQDYEVITAARGHEGLRHLQTTQIDLVMLDIQLPDVDGLTLLQTIEQEGIETTVVIVTAYGSIEQAVKAIQAGAYDFIQKPYETGRLRVSVEKAMERARLHREIAYLRSEASEAVPSLIGESAGMKKVVQTARKAAQSNATILLLGESGTGKEVLARAIHRMSPRYNEPFIGVNCVALAENLLESELFGHERGAFSGAVRQKKGKFEIAHGGTMLFDEIGATTPDFQKRLLRILQEGEFERVGGERTIKVDVRVIAATNRNLQRAIAEGTFLEDLYYRLNVVQIVLPPLRERKEDIPLLAYHFLKKYADDLKRPRMHIVDTTVQYLIDYDWPGNIRELENTIERAVVLCSNDEIRPADLPIQITGKTVAPSGSTRAATVDQLIREMIEAHRTNPAGNVITALQEMAVRVALEQASGNKSRAARLLGYPPSQRKRLERLMEKYDIGVEE